MSLLVGIPDWILNPSEMKDNFGITQAGLVAAFEGLNQHFSDESVAKRNAQKEQLNNDLLAASGDIKAKCDAYNTSINQGDVILQGRLNCDDFNDVSKVFSGEVANFKNIQNQLATIDDFDISKFIPTLTEVNIDKGIIRGHKKLLKKFILHVMVNSVVIWQWSFVPIRIDLGKVVSQLLSVVAGIISLLLLISFLMSGFFPPFGWFTIPLPMCLRDSSMTNTCEEMYYFYIKPYNKAHKEYIKKMNALATDHSSDENTQARNDEYAQVKDTYENELKTAIANLEKEIADLEKKITDELNTIQQQDVGDEILIGKESDDLSLGVVNYSFDCYDGIITQTDTLYNYASGAVPLIQDNVNRIVVYNDYARNNITKSYENYLNLKEESDGVIVDAQTFSGIVSQSGNVALSENFNSLFTSTGLLASLNIFDSGVLSKSIDLIFNTTNTNDMKDIVKYYDANTTLADQVEIDKLIKTFKPYVDTPQYDAKFEIGKLIDEIGSDFSTQKNNFNSFTMFAPYQTTYVIDRVDILEYIVKVMLVSLEKQINELKAQLEENDNQQTKKQIDALLVQAKALEEILNKFTRLRLYYEKKPLQYLIDAKGFNLPIQTFQGKITGLLSVDSSGNVVENPVDYTGPIDLASEEEKLKEYKKEFETLKEEKLIAVDFTASIKNFVGSTTEITSGGKTKVNSKFETDYNQIIYYVSELNNIDAKTQSIVEQTLKGNEDIHNQTIQNISIYASKTQTALANIKYTYSKNAILKLVRSYMTEEKDINKKIDDRTKFLNDEIARLNNEINTISSVSTQGNSSLIGNIKEQVDSRKQLIATYQAELDAMPAKLDLGNYYLYLMCVPLAIKRVEVDAKKTQLAAGLDGFKPLIIPPDPFDELYNGCYAIVKSYMKHMYMNYKTLANLFSLFIPFPVPCKFTHQILHEANIKKTAKNLAQDIKSGDNGNVFDQIVNIFISGKLKKHLSLHLATYGVLVPYAEPFPNPIYWFGVPPFVVPPTYIPIPGVLSQGQLY